MPDISLRGLLYRLHRELKSAAKRNHRSLNGEILARLAASVLSEPVNVEKLLERIRLRHQTMGRIDLSEETFREMRNAGRP